MERHPRPLRSTASPTWGGTSLRSEGSFWYICPPPRSPSGALSRCRSSYVCRRSWTDLHTPPPPDPKHTLCKLGLRLVRPHGLYIMWRFAQSGLRFMQAVPAGSVPLGQRPRGTFARAPRPAFTRRAGTAFAGGRAFGPARFIAGDVRVLTHPPHSYAQIKLSNSVIKLRPPPPPFGPGAGIPGGGRWDQRTRQIVTRPPAEILGVGLRAHEPGKLHARPTNVAKNLLDFCGQIIYI